MPQSKYDYEAIEHMVYEEGMSWERVAEVVGAPTAHSGMSLRVGYYRWRDRMGRPKQTRIEAIKDWDDTDERGRPAIHLVEQPEDEEKDVLVSKSGISKHRITTLDELFDFFEIPYRWIEGEHGEKIPVSDDYEVVSFRINSWEQHSVKKGVTTCYQVKAALRPREALESAAALQAMFDELVMFHAAMGPGSEKLPQPEPALRNASRPQLMEVCILDPHLGMLAWGREVGENYDLEIGLADYRRAFNELLGWAKLYNIEEILLHVGHDLFHVDAPGMDVRGGARGGATTAGTQQDIDTRLARMFVKVEQLIIGCITDAAQTFPKVTVQLTPGNHDRHTVYKLGRVIEAWFREVPHVEVRNEPRTRSFYRYGNNVFMFCHGEEYKRLRDNLALIFATECPADWWADCKIREIHVGHNHINMEKVWDGKEVDKTWEGRAIRARSLPGLTPEDSWHFEQGYHHRRRATVMIWDRRGGMAGYHEVTLL